MWCSPCGEQGRCGLQIVLLVSRERPMRDGKLCSALDGDLSAEHCRHCIPWAVSPPTHNTHDHTRSTPVPASTSDQRESVTWLSLAFPRGRQGPTVHLPTGARVMGGSIPEYSLPFLIGHHSLVMFTLMSYMFISHGPSLIQMGLWSDIPS